MNAEELAAAATELRGKRQAEGVSLRDLEAASHELGSGFSFATFARWEQGSVIARPVYIDLWRRALALAIERRAAAAAQGGVP